MVKNKSKSVVREYTEAIVIAVVLALFIRTFIVQAFKIPSGSMLPTLKIGDHLLVNKFIYGIKMPFTGTLLVPIKKPERYDIIVFRYPEDPKTDYIKRVIGTPGDKIEIRDKVVFVNGEQIADTAAHFTDSTIIPAKMKQSRIFKGGPNKDNFGPILVPENKWFVMGDNRDNSYDSRFWGFVDENEILGKAMIIYWSWDLNKPLFSLDRFSSIQFSRIGNIIE